MRSAAALLAAGTVLGLAVPADALPVCGGGRRIACVVDGDTLWLDGVKIRLSGVDAPETDGARCPAEADLGRRATRRLAELLSAGPFDLRPTGETDRYGRILADIATESGDAGEALISEGLARPWSGLRSWCR